MADARSFLFAVCQVGAERALKAEVGRLAPSLRSAFARPGLVTWKSPDPVGPDVALPAVFARAYGAALGPAVGVEAVLALARAVASGAPLRLHVWARDTHAPGEEPPPPAVTDGSARVAALRAALLAAPSAPFLPPGGDDRARPGEHVLDVVVGEGDEPLFVGHHRHAAGHSPHPGGRIPVDVPADAPSRAYRKLVEALAWSGAPVRHGDVAVEIGSAPGGASLALLRRGLSVVGVDPGAMAPVVLATPGFRHLRKAAGEVAPAELPPRVAWLVLDVNLAPQVALRAASRLVAATRPSLCGVLFTLKLNDWALAAKVPDLLRRVAAMGLVDVRATQLPSNRQEIFVAALTERGLARQAARER